MRQDIENFISRLDALATIAAAQYAARYPDAARYPTAPYLHNTPTFSVKYGTKFATIVRTNSRLFSGTNSYGMVALADGQTKELGAYKAGDVFYIAGRGKPARGVRGSIYDTNIKPFTGYYQVAYVADIKRGRDCWAQ